jgi:hypothetical protein
MHDGNFFLLTDLASGVWVDAFEIGDDDPASGASWSIRKMTLRGGRRDGVDLIEVNNGAFSFAIVPTRGMGIWRGSYRGINLGWQAPLLGPVHPKFVNLMYRGGLGWLEGFDEWICRCGLSSNGPPGEDPHTKEFLPLHGRIANTPAQRVAIHVNREHPYELRVSGVVEEGALFFPRLRLESTVTTAPGANWLRIEDKVTNCGTKPAELELLYHCNFSMPILGEGSRLVAPVRELWPRNEHAAAGVAAYDRYLDPTPGFTEQVYFFDLLADAQGWASVLLHGARADVGVCVRMLKSGLPRFIQWKNTAAVEDGYVTGLEPATNYPNPRWVEREQGRVIALPPHGMHSALIKIDVFDTPAGVADCKNAIAAVQAQAEPRIHESQA